MRAGTRPVLLGGIVRPAYAARVHRVLRSAGEPSAIATASVERCQESWWPTSATEACRRSRRWAFTRLSSARLAFSEPDSKVQMNVHEHDERAVSHEPVVPGT